MRCKVIDRVPYMGNTLVTVPYPIEPIRVGDPVNNGTSKVVSIAMIDSRNSAENKQITLVVSGSFDDDELYY